MTQSSGAQILIKELERLGVTHIFGYPGGAAINIFDALYSSSIELVLTRHEQGATHMADGYARATGRLGVVLVTSGPGALNSVSGLLTAKMDSVPILVISGQTNSVNLGKDAFQEADVFGVTLSLVKHNRLILDVDDIAPAVRQAAALACEGRPGPVLLDLPKDISAAMTFYDPQEVESWVVKTEPKELRPAQRSACQRMAALLMESKRPLLLVGHGAVIAGAAAQVIKLAETLRSPVTNTLLGKGAFPEHHPWSLGMLGMHGTAYANYATTRCDLILSIGSRVDDRINGGVGKRWRLASPARGILPIADGAPDPRHRVRRIDIGIKRAQLGGDDSVAAGVENLAALHPDPIGTVVGPVPGAARRIHAVDCRAR